MYSLLAGVENDGDISIGGSVGEGIGNQDGAGHHVLQTVDEGNLCTNLTMINTDNASQPWPKWY